jgi:hypothetical protein
MQCAAIVPGAGPRRSAGFEFRDARFERRDRRFDLLGGVARRDVLRAIPIEAFDVEHKRALDAARSLTSSAKSGRRSGLTSAALV